MTTSTAVKPKRLTGLWMTVLVLLGISVFLNYIDRGNLAIAAPMVKDELGISASRLGILLSAFFWTYACMVPVSGWLVDRLNVKWVMAGGFFLWSIATAGTGTARTFVMLFLLRLVLGIGESVAFPSYSKVIALNFPEEHRGFANSFVSSGLVLGPGFGMLFGGMMMARFGWRVFFVALGLGSLLWLIPWIKYMPSTRGAPKSDNDGVPSLGEFLRLRSAWGTCLGLFCGNYVNYFLITWLPFYLVRERHFSLDQMARIGGGAYLLGACCSMLSGWLSDRWIASGATPNLVRKTFTGGGLALSGIALAASSIVGPRACAVLVTIAVIGLGAGASNVFSITQTLAGPRAAGRWTGFQCFVGNLSGIVVPAVTGLVVQRTGHFQWALVILAGVALTGTTMWVFLVGPIEPVVWHQELRVRAAVA